MRVARLEADLRVAQQSQVLPGRDSSNGNGSAAAINADSITVKHGGDRGVASPDPEPYSPSLSPAQPQPPPSLLGTGASGSDARKFSCLPSAPVLKSLADVYFSNCHNQPYCFFHENSFRRRLLAGELPQYLLLAFAATAARYSSHDYFRDKQLDAVEGFSRAAWIIILDQVFATEDNPDSVTAAQATSLLAIIDFTGELPKSDP